jgi:hypothetical protein
VSWFGLIVGDDIFVGPEAARLGVPVIVPCFWTSALLLSHPSTSHLPILIMTLVYNSQPGVVLIPREYQKGIFLKAQQTNVIAVLDTGSGKTLISALLIKWIATLEHSQEKVTVFLVPKVPLVEQQNIFVAQHRVAQVHSEVSARIKTEQTMAVLRQRERCNNLEQIDGGKNPLGVLHTWCTKCAVRRPWMGRTVLISDQMHR